MMNAQELKKVLQGTYGIQEVVFGDGQPETQTKPYCEIITIMCTSISEDTINMLDKEGFYCTGAQMNPYENKPALFISFRIKVADYLKSLELHK